MIKSRRLRGASYVGLARMEEGRNTFKILTDKPTEKRNVLNKWNSISSAQYRGLWRTLVNAALNLRVS